MSEDPRTPSIPEPEGDSSTPGAENNQPAEPTKPAPFREELEPRRRGTGTLIHRFTGSLRRVTSFLGTGELRAEPEEPEPAAPAEPPQEPQTQQENVSQADSIAQPGYMFTGELRADLSLEMEESEPEAPAKPTSPAAIDWTAELRKEQVAETPETGQLPEQPETGQPGTGNPLSDLEGIDIPLDRMPQMTGQLRSAFTGFLRGSDEDSDITDDMLTGRLGGMETPALSPERTNNLPPLTGELEDLRSEMPIDESSFVAQAPEAQEEELPEDRFGMFLEPPPAAPIVPSEPFQPSVSDLDRVAEDVWQEPPDYNRQQPQPIIPIEDIWGTISERTEEPVVDLAEAQAEVQPESEAVEVETPPEVHLPIRTAKLLEPELEEVEPPVVIPPVPAEPVAFEPAGQEEAVSVNDLEPVEPVVPASLYDMEAPSVTPQAVLPEKAEEEPFQAPAQEAAPKPKDEDLSSLRETLTSEEARKRRGSGLFGRITSSLRRVTGSLGGTGKVGGTGSLRSRPSLPPEKVSGDSEEFVTGRLGMEGTPPASAQPPDLQSTFADIYALPSEEAEPAEQEPVAEEEAFSFPTDQPSVPETAEQTGWMTELRQETTAESETFSSPLSTASLDEKTPRPRGVTGQLRSFITTILRGPQERKSRTSGLDISDDVVTGRLEKTMVTGKLKKERPAAEEPDYLEETPIEAIELPPGTPQFDAEVVKTSKLGGTKPRGVTGQLRSFITSILRLPEEREKDTGILELPEVPEAPSKSVTGRMGSSVTSEPLPSETFDIWGPSVETSEPDTSERVEMIDDLYNFTPSQPSYPESAPSAGLEEEAAPIDRFSMFFGDQAAVDADETFEEQEETGQVQWGSRQGTVMPGDLPDIFISEEDVAQQAKEQPVESWQEEEEQEYRQTGSLFGEATDDDLIASYLGGLNLPVAGAEAEVAGEELEAVPGSEDLTAYNLRGVALEGYQDIYEPRTQPAEEAAEAALAEGGAAALGEAVAQPEAEEFQPDVEEKFNLKAWLSVRRNFRLILLAEVVLILLAALVMSPVFMAALRGTPQQARGPFLVAKPLPADVPYPTEVTFPGGWDFPLQKSTFVEDQWQPKTAEWLEGTEVRRVLALPWNPQTEAVVQTFKPGDTVELVLSNQDMVDYKITSIERVPVSDTSIYTDKKPSMVIILYEENAQDRWVVTCRP